MTGNWHGVNRKILMTTGQSRDYLEWESWGGSCPLSRVRTLKRNQVSEATGTAKERPTVSQVIGPQLMSTTGDFSNISISSLSLTCTVKHGWKKNVNLDHLISRAWHFIRPEEGGEPWHELEARGGRGLPNAPSKNTDTRERWHLDPRGLEGQIYE